MPDAKQELQGSDDRGRFAWFDLLTTDPEAAIDFYTDVVGWTITEFTELDEPYQMWTAGETSLGGSMKLPDEAVAQGARPNWLAYISTPDVDATAAQAVELGGKVMHPAEDIPGVGRFAVLQDPQGASFAVYKSASDNPVPEGPPKTGEFSWHELMTTDYEAALRFYQDLFGWEAMEAMDMGPMGIYQIYGRGGMPLGGIFNRSPEMPATAWSDTVWLYYVSVEDLDGKAEKVKQRGGQVVNGPIEVPGGDRIVQCLDPQGAMFAMHERGAGG